MYIKRDWSISVDEKEYMALMGDSFGRLLKNPGKLDTFQAALKEIEESIEPVACWDRFAIQKFLHDKLVLANGARIGGGPVVSVVAVSLKNIVAVCSVGSAVDRLIEEAQQARQLFKALVLNDMAAWAVDMVRQQLCLWLEREAKEGRYHISAPLSPGESVWSVEDQAVIFSLLDASQIKVSLSPGHWLPAGGRRRGLELRLLHHQRSLRLPALAASRPTYSGLIQVLLFEARLAVTALGLYLQ
jgi:hypothetical protein